jgi:hypothetical protein
LYATRCHFRFSGSTPHLWTRIRLIPTCSTWPCQEKRSTILTKNELGTFSLKNSQLNFRLKKLDEKCSKMLIRYVFCFVLCVPSVKVSKLFLFASLTQCASLCFLPNHNFYAKVLSLTITTGDCTFYAVFLEFLFFISKLLESEKGNTGFIYNISQISSNFFLSVNILSIGVQ